MSVIISAGSLGVRGGVQREFVPEPRDETTNPLATTGKKSRIAFRPFSWAGDDPFFGDFPWPRGTYADLIPETDPIVAGLYQRPGSNPTPTYGAGSDSQGSWGTL